jgi:Xaa-Pro aminopeptidase
MVHEMRLFKSPEELEVMRRAGEISALAHTRAMQKCRPGMFEYQLEGEILHEFNRHGARFPPITPSWAVGKTAVFSITRKTNPSCAMAIWC